MERDSNGRAKAKERAEPAGQRRQTGLPRGVVPGERVAIFVDGSNLYNGMRENLRNTRVNLAELIQQLLRDRPLFRTYYYNAPLTEDYDEELREGQARFFDSLRRIPYVTVRFGKLHRRPDGSMVEKGIDVAIAVESTSRPPCSVTSRQGHSWSTWTCSRTWTSSTGAGSSSRPRERRQPACARFMSTGSCALLGRRRCLSAE